LLRESDCTAHQLIGEVTPPEALWRLPGAIKLVEKQLPDGSWKYPGKTVNPESGQNYYLLETFRNLRVLVEVYAFNGEHPTLESALEYVLSCQSAEGDVRGILGNQYMPYYHGAILEPLIKAGYGEDGRVEHGLEWLIEMRQEDGGWIVPAQAISSKERTPDFWRGAPLPPDRSLPHAHMATGMALRALAAHPEYRHRPETVQAGEALKGRLFKADEYNDRKAKSYWFKFQFPFWWTNLLTALDSLFKLGFDRQEEEIDQGLRWFRENQEADGLWPTGYAKGAKAEWNRCWVGLAVCRVLKRYMSDPGLGEKR
jgi:hypothetical protein